MLNRIKNFFGTLLTSLVAFLVSRLDKGLDGVIANLTKMDANLDRFVEKQKQAMNAEAALRSASYKREQATLDTTIRAMRIKDRVRALID